MSEICLIKKNSILAICLFKYFQCIHLCYIQKFNVEDYEVQRALLEGDPMDQLCIAYHLILDNNRIADQSKYIQYSPN